VLLLRKKVGLFIRGLWLQKLALNLIKYLLSICNPRNGQARYKERRSQFLASLHGFDLHISISP
jgi:hypothetical protein